MSNESQRVLSEKWFVVSNDLIGGWSVVNVEAQFFSEIELPAGRDREILWCWSKDVAEHIADQHNATAIGEEGIRSTLNAVAYGMLSVNDAIKELKVLGL